MIDLLKRGFNYITDGFYFKLAYLIVSICTITIFSNIPKLNLITKLLIVWGVILVINNFVRLLSEKITLHNIFLCIFIVSSVLLVFLRYRNGENIKIIIINLILFFGMFYVDDLKSKKELIKEVKIISLVYFIFSSLLSIGSLIIIFKKINIVINGQNYGFDIQNGNNTGLYVHENSLGLAAAIAIIVGIYLLVEFKNNIIRAIIGIVLLLNGAALFYSKGRSGFILILALIIMIIFVYWKNISMRTVFIISIIILITISIINIKVSWDVFLSGRAQLWITAFESIKQNSIFGIGNSSMVSNLIELLPEMQKYGVVILSGIEAGGLHNIFIQIAVVYGLPSLIIFVLILTSVFVYIVYKLDMLKGYYKTKITILVSLCFGIVGVNFFESNLIFIISFISLIFWTYMGYAVRLVEKK
ncbi:O-antigen ligase family protein [Clostridium intestinale]|uniref:O-antigen ligase n=1 Tax=Clostridium intestinale DSM 6191 TaxID=1121320 RepID=A0A1M5Z0P2_9CLOT|nr:O-antigen ligase family protein [Clostridium intestinale]SHI17872.1 O-antigen ligase [Clostridium intestinale DSM 6191]